MHSICDKFTSIHSGYRTTIWCFPSTLNTIVFAKLQACIKQNYDREILTTQDGGIQFLLQSIVIYLILLYLRMNKIWHYYFSFLTFYLFLEV